MRNRYTVRVNNTLSTANNKGVFLQIFLKLIYFKNYLNICSHLPKIALANVSNSGNVVGNYVEAYK